MKAANEIDLICFDVDGTLVSHPTGMVIWEVLNLRFGGSRETNRERYQMYQRGDITYEEWVALDAGGWKSAGATRDQILHSVGEFKLNDGAEETVNELKQRGFILAVISGTIDVVLEHLFPGHPFDDVYTNQIFFDEHGKLDSWQATPFDGRGKPQALREVAHKHGIALSESAFVGDGDNDVPLLGVPGFFVAYEPRSRALASGADVVIREGKLRSLLDIFQK
ncbi:MAG: HAD family phosphatase [Candidatus Krumholzibacteria bacterium]|nr:HAD family phosphatase [Candidatus Krumholzibacteria bacterium]